MTGPLLLHDARVSISALRDRAEKQDRTALHRPPADSPPTDSCVIRGAPTIPATHVEAGEDKYPNLNLDPSEPPLALLARGSLNRR